jgi:hypothetical protein
MLIFCTNGLWWFPVWLEVNHGHLFRGLVAKVPHTKLKPAVVKVMNKPLRKPGHHLGFGL